MSAKDAARIAKHATIIAADATERHMDAPFKFQSRSWTQP